MPFLWPDTPSDRDRMVLSLRGDRAAQDPWRAPEVLLEDEPAADGTTARVATLFLTGRECPWRCAMCDLWRHTTTADTPGGAIPAQIATALHRLRTGPFPTVAKLYNAGSFFDPRAVPEGDYDAIAAQLREFDRIIVESHPALVGARVDMLLEALDEAGESRGTSPALEVAMGLETAHPRALEQLNKRMTVEQFAVAASSLAARGVALRVFLLIGPPFVPRLEQDDWLFRSLDVAVRCGATAVSLIPTRSGNGTMEQLTAEGVFDPPHLNDIDRAATLAMAHVARRCRLFVDTWDLARFASCDACRAARHHRLRTMNLQQQLLEPIDCDVCR